MPIEVWLAMVLSQEKTYNENEDEDDEDIEDYEDNC